MISGVGFLIHVTIWTLFWAFILKVTLFSTLLGIFRCHAGVCRDVTKVLRLWRSCPNLFRGGATAVPDGPEREVPEDPRLPAGGRGGPGPERVQNDKTPEEEITEVTSATNFHNKSLRMVKRSVENNNVKI